MDALELIRRSLAHCAWANRLVLEALRTNPNLSAAIREYAHVAAAEAVWLARLEGRPQPVPVWPALTLDQADALEREVAAGYERFLGALTPDGLEGGVEYTNSAGQSFETRVVDILLHVALHGQYHRGKINLMLREGGHEPVPTDYISFARGVPAAITARAAP